MKAGLFKQLDSICTPGVILASNTSSISITRLAEVTGRPEKVVGMHFFNPVPVMPPVEIVHHVTPSPHTVLGQKGSGESGYLGAPAAVSGAINDALRPLGISVDKLPIRISALGDMIAAAAKGKGE